MHIRNLGRVDAYIELLQAGIRDVCMPNHGYPKSEQLDYIHREARKNGLGTLLVTYNRTRPNGEKFKSYQRIMYCKGQRSKAELLRKTLQKTSKAKNDHRIMGRLLGYSDKAIKSFIESLNH